jgi:uracil phosphoribosyltransferase
MSHGLPNLTVIDHPLVQHKLTYLRNKDTTTGTFRILLREVSQLLAYEATRDLPTELIDITTPVTAMRSPVLGHGKLCVVSVLRAGNGMLDGLLALLPSARVGHIGLVRDPQTLLPTEYYFKVPDDIAQCDVIVVDPMLATGNSVVAAIARLKECGCKSVKLVCLLAAPEGVRRVGAEHPDVPIITASLDSHLNEHGYIVPGLGDAGDRMFGTN